MGTGGESRPPVNENEQLGQGTDHLRLNRTKQSPAERRGPGVLQCQISLKVTGTGLAVTSAESQHNETLVP